MAIHDEQGIDRRRFMALLGASAALAAAGCGDRDRGEIVGYSRPPEGAVAGTPRFYASTLTATPGAPAVVVTTREGRAIKVEGSTAHPESGGGLGWFGQAATWSLYDPDRLRAPRHGGRDVSWSAVDDQIVSALTAATGERLTILVVTPALVSPSARGLLREFLEAYPTARHVAVETFHQGEVVEGWRAAGLGAAPAIAWNAVDVLVAVESDVLGLDGTASDQRGFASRRNPDADRGMARLWAIEGSPSLTGTSADHRLAVRPSNQPRLLLGLLHEFVVSRRLGPLASRRDVAAVLAPFPLPRVAEQLGLEMRVVEALVKDVVEHPRRAAIVGGPALPAAAHVAIAALNACAGSLGEAVRARRAVVPLPSPDADVAAAVRDMAAGRVAVVLNLGANPAYVLPRGSGFGHAVRKVRLVVTSALVPDETAALSQVVLPACHDLESWGDADVHDGVISLQQPAMRPLFGARQAEECLLTWLRGARGPASYGEYVKSRWQREVYPLTHAGAEFPAFWHAALQAGFVNLPTAASEAAMVPGAASQPSIDAVALVSAIEALAAIQPAGFDVVLSPGYHVFDGRYANNGWLQELPHPVTTQVWGNGAVMGASTAARLGCADGEIVRIRVGDRSIDLPAVVEPGGAPEVVKVELGHGRGAAGRIGTGVGVNAGALRSLAPGTGGRVSPWVYGGATVVRTGRRGTVVRAQRYPRSEKRPLAVDATLEEYRADPKKLLEAVRHGGNVPSPGGWRYDVGPRWVMVVDLARCTGCNACVAACCAENNVPVVGPGQVLRERQMQWVRVDRYYDSAGDAARVVRQPVMCQHCENAPCENVCPVAATVHTPDGLNQMTYNRCVGTRYCANNCPYKVRRFNFLDYQGALASPQPLRMNPEVTVRSRGVMEKCTFCVQRLRAAQHAARREGRALKDGEAATACEQACPTGAITFGDVNDRSSRVRALAASARGYHLLGELGVVPSVVYLAGIRHPHPDLNA